MEQVIHHRNKAMDDYSQAKANLDMRIKIVYIICFLIAVLFLYAAMSKLFSYEKYLTDLARSPFLEKHVSYLGILIPLSEIVISFLFLFQRTRLLGLILAFAIMLMFTAYVALILDTQHKLPCSCGGLIRQLSWRGHLAMNLSCTVIIATGILLEKKL